MFTRILKWWYRNTSPADMPMVSYWKRTESISAKVTKAKDGSTIMIMEGEKQPFPTFPRGHILFGHLSKIKHEIKNKIFNESWAKLEEGKDKQEIIKDIKVKLFESIAKEAEKSRYDMLPTSAMTPSVREIHRAWTKVSPQTGILRDYICFILQEDDSYRFRVQWLYQWFGWLFKLNPVKSFEYSLKMLEHGEVVSDMKERIRLLRRVLLLALEDESIKKQFIALFKEIKWSKVKLTEADKYHFRGKYFKCDLKYLEY
jgi:hypothetical protein